MGSLSTDPRPGQTSANGRGAWTNRKAQACLGRTLSAGQDRPARSSPCHDSWGSTGTGSRRRACTPHSCQSLGGTNSSAQTGRRSSCSHRKPRGHTRWRRAGRSSTGRDMDRAGRGWSFAGCSPLCHRPGAPALLERARRAACVGRQTRNSVVNHLPMLWCPGFCGSSLIS